MIGRLWRWLFNRSEPEVEKLTSPPPPKKELAQANAVDAGTEAAGSVIFAPPGYSASNPQDSGLSKSTSSAMNWESKPKTSVAVPKAVATKPKVYNLTGRSQKAPDSRWPLTVPVPPPATHRKSVLSRFDEDPPIISISLEAWTKMFVWTEHCDYEVGGIGYVLHHQNNYHVYDVELIKQTVSGVEVDMDPQAVSLKQRELFASGQGDKITQMFFQWHSHVNMTARFSPVDLTLINSWNGRELISLVINKQGDFSMRWDVMHPVRTAYYIDPYVVVERDPELIARCAAEFSELVTTPRLSTGSLKRKLGRQDQGPDISNIDPFTRVSPSNIAFGGGPDIEFLPSESGEGLGQSPQNMESTEVLSVSTTSPVEEAGD